MGIESFKLVLKGSDHERKKEEHSNPNINAVQEDEHRQIKLVEYPEIVTKLNCYKWRSCLVCQFCLFCIFVSDSNEK